MTRHLTKEASDQEERDLLDLLTKAPKQQFLYDLLSAYWHESNSSLPPLYENSDEHFRYIVESAQKLQSIRKSSSASFCPDSFLEKVKFKL